MRLLKILIFLFPLFGAKIVIYAEIFNDFQPKSAIQYPLDDIRITDTESDWFFRSKGYLAYSEDTLNLRHSYNWFIFSGGVEIMPNFWLSGSVILQKFSFSYTIGDGGDFKESFRIIGLPLFTFKGTPMQLIKPYEKSSGSSPCLLHSEIGTLSRAQIANGLVIAEFDGLGVRNRLQCGILGFELMVLGSGYESADDVVSLHLDVWDRLLQAGAVYEQENPFGARIIPTLASNWLFAKGFALYTEAGLSMRIKSPARFAQISTKTKDNKFIDESLYVPNYFNQNTLQSNVAALAGLKASFSHWLPKEFLFETISEFRMYGSEYNNFYESSRKQSFNQPIFIFSDLLSNRQPRNFFVRNGKAVGAYLRQDLLWSPTAWLTFRVRNEILILQNTVISGLKKYTLDDIYSIRVEYSPNRRLKFGIMGSDVLMGVIERQLQQQYPDFYSSRSPFWLESKPRFMVDFYLRYKLE